MSKLKVDVIEAGGICYAHLPHLMPRIAITTMELVAIADIRRQCGSGREMQNSTSSLSVAEVISDLIGAVDAVLVCIPTHLHASFSARSLESRQSRLLRKAHHAHAGRCQSHGGGLTRQPRASASGFRAPLR